MNWKHGYYADSGYTYGHYPETMPARLRWAALIQGHQCPTGRFRYLDAGCGQGLNLIIAAACHPDSEFVGIDFLPEHIAHARMLATQCGLSNVRFIEGDFVELAKQPESLGEFDFAVCHGITTWIAPSVKQALFQLIGQVLKPGGVFYNSYNTYPGWLGAVPFQHLVLLEQRSKPGALALRTAQQHMSRLKSEAQGFFAALPGLQARLDMMEKQDPAYLVQEYNNLFWQPVFVTQMMDEMSASKLSYLGTATLAEAYDAILQPDIRALLAEQTSPSVREQLRDYAVNQSFRRDLYAKGLSKPWRVDQVQQVRDVHVMASTTTARPAEGEPYIIKGGALELKGAHDFYSALLDKVALKPEGVSVGSLIDGQPDEFKSNVVQAVTLLIHGGWLALVSPQAKPIDCRKANQAMARAAVAGAPYRYVIAPKIGSSVILTETDWALLQATFEKTDGNKRVDHAIAILTSMGKGLGRDGQPITDPAAQRELMAELAHKFDQTLLPWLRRTGAV